MNHAEIPDKTQDFIYDRLKKQWKVDGPRTGQSSTLRMQIVTIRGIPGWFTRKETMSNLNRVAAPPEDATFLDFGLRHYWTRPPARIARKWVIGYFRKASLDTCFPQLLDLAGAADLTQTQQAISLERWLWKQHRDEIRAADDRHAHYCKVIDRYRATVLF